MSRGRAWGWVAALRSGATTPWLDWPADGSGEGVALDAEVTRQAVTIAYLNDFRFMMYLSLLAIPLLLLLRTPRAAARAAAR